VKPEDNSINKPEDLAGKKVGAQVNTTSSRAAEKFQNTVKFELTKYDQVIQPFADLKTGRIEAIVVDEMVGKDYQTKEPESYKVTTAKLTNEPIGVVFSKANTELKEKVDAIIDGMRADGSLKGISEKWFQGEDRTSNIDTTVTED
jgi:polar amino acid transport system substrate-binding protein